MHSFWKKAKSNLQASQEVMKYWYDQKNTLVEFQPGDKVWVMEPVEPRALQDHWTGPFEIKERKGEATYLVDLQSPRNPLRVFHVKRLKPHFDRTEGNMHLVKDEGVEEQSEPLPDLLSAQEGDGSVEGVNLSESLTLDQLSDGVKASIKEEVTKMLALGVFEKSSSPWSSPVVLVPKAAAPGGKPELRFCVDYRALNSVTKTDTHPIPS
ncbi:hypothetical protein NDU88_007841 [Pleurodeles waltl]|uniref:Uncharacterized protein n=1 Tax=Pleurodeles waltl TaxID=8319 RepID=A0AAV7U4Y6_PLEWA|nr:hypothetical protein NDU88_007841 [Pleurodeles waltl]